MAGRTERNPEQPKWKRLKKAAIWVAPILGGTAALLLATEPSPGALPDVSLGTGAVAVIAALTTWAATSLVVSTIENEPGATEPWKNQVEASIAIVGAMVVVPATAMWTYFTYFDAKKGALEIAHVASAVRLGKDQALFRLTLRPTNKGLLPVKARLVAVSLHRLQKWENPTLTSTDGSTAAIRAAYATKAFPVVSHYKYEKIPKEGVAQWRTNHPYDVAAFETTVDPGETQSIYMDFLLDPGIEHLTIESVWTPATGDDDRMWYGLPSYPRCSDDQKRMPSSQNCWAGLRQFWNASTTVDVVELLSSTKQPSSPPASLITVAPRISLFGD